MLKFYCIVSLFIVLPILISAQSGDIKNLYKYNLNIRSSFYYVQQGINFQNTSFNTISLSTNVLNVIPIDIGIGYFLETEPKSKGRFSMLTFGLDFDKARGNLQRARSKYQRVVNKSFREIPFEQNYNFYLDSLMKSLPDSVQRNNFNKYHFSYSDSLQLYNEYLEKMYPGSTDTLKFERLKIDSVRQRKFLDLIEKDSISQVLHAEKWFEKGIVSNISFVNIGTFVPRSNSQFLSDLRMDGLSFETKIIRNTSVQYGIGATETFTEYPSANFRFPNIFSLNRKFNNQYLILKTTALSNKLDVSFNMLKSDPSVVRAESLNEQNGKLLIYSGLSKFSFDKEKQKIEFEIGKSSTLNSEVVNLSQTNLFHFKYSYQPKSGLLFNVRFSEIGNEFDTQNSPFLQKGRREWNLLMQISKQKYFLIPMFSFNSSTDIDIYQVNKNSNKMYFLQGGWIPSASFKVQGDFSYFSSKFLYSSNQYTAVGVGLENLKRIADVVLTNKIYVKASQNAVAVEGIKKFNNDLRVKLSNHTLLSCKWALGVNTDWIIQNIDESNRSSRQLYSINAIFSIKKFSISGDYGIEKYLENMALTQIISTGINWRILNNWIVNLTCYSYSNFDINSQSQYRVQFSSRLTI